MFRRVFAASHVWWPYLAMDQYLHTIFRGMNIHLPAILMFTRRVLTHPHLDHGPPLFPWGIPIHWDQRLKRGLNFRRQLAGGARRASQLRLFSNEHCGFEQEKSKMSPTKCGFMMVYDGLINIDKCEFMMIYEERHWKTWFKRIKKSMILTHRQSQEHSLMRLQLRYNYWKIYLGMS